MRGKARKTCRIGDSTQVFSERRYAKGDSSLVELPMKNHKV
jgi:hypothetical protein